MTIAANNNTAALPQYWAFRGLRMLFGLTPALGAVNRQFSPQLASAGSEVTAWRADPRETRRKDGADPYTTTGATLTPVPVKLDQLFYDTCIIGDEENALTIPELTQAHLPRMIQSIARGINRSILGRVHAFLRQGDPSKRAGRLLGMTNANAADFILEAEEVLADNLAPMDANDGLRTAIVHHTVNTKMMGSDVFERQDARSGDGTARGTVRTGQVGVVYNTAVVMSQDVNYVNPTKVAAQVQTAGTINNSGGYLAGTTTALTVTDPGDNWQVGEYVVVDGNDQPTFISATNGTTSITLNEALKYDVLNSAVITHYRAMANDTVVLPVGYKKDVTITHSANRNLVAGQLISFGTGASRHTYSVIEIRKADTTSTQTTVLLDHPLEAQVGSAETCFPGPAGSMNPIFHQDALAFVSRPMMPVGPSEGASSAVVNYRGVGMRVVMQYLAEKGGRHVNVDILAGVSPLDLDLMCVMLA